MPRFLRTPVSLVAFSALVGVISCSLIGGCGGSPANSNSPDNAIAEETPHPDAGTGALDSSQSPVSATSAGPKFPESAGQKPETKAHEMWLTDWSRAKTLAQAEGKDILINFTGSDWCIWCIRLHEEVFDHAEFQEYAHKHFVLLELDFPRDKSRISEQKLAQNQKLQERFGIQGFPTILLTDAKGRPYARSGYQEGGPLTYNEHLATLTKVRADRDAAFAAAEQSSDVARAVELDRALQTIPPELILPAYEAEVAEIIRSDDANQAGLREQYQERLAASQFQQKIQGVVQYVQTTNDLDGTLKKIEGLRSEFSEYQPGLLSLGLLRLQLLQIGQRTDDVLKTADALLVDKDAPVEARLKFHSAKLTALAGAKRFEQALEVAGVMRTEFPDDPHISTQLLIAQADFLSKLNRPEEGRAALEEARQLADASMLQMIDRAEQTLFPPQANSAESPAEE